MDHESIHSIQSPILHEKENLCSRELSRSSSTSWVSRLQRKPNFFAYAHRHSRHLACVPTKARRCWKALGSGARFFPIDHVIGRRCDIISPPWCKPKPPKRSDKIPDSQCRIPTDYAFRLQRVRAGAALEIFPSPAHGKVAQEDLSTLIDFPVRQVFDLLAHVEGVLQQLCIHLQIDGGHHRALYRRAGYGAAMAALRILQRRI